MRDFQFDFPWEWYKSDNKDEDNDNIALIEALIQASNQYEAEESQLQALNNIAAASGEASGSTTNVPRNAVSSSALSSNPQPLRNLLPTSSSSNPLPAPPTIDLQNWKQPKKCAERDH